MIIKVTCAIIVSNTKILAAKRSNTMPHSGYWEFPGGKIEDDELPEDCLIREIQEELDCTIEINHQLPSFSHQFSDKHIELLPFICSIKSGIPKPIEHSTIEWFSKPDLLKLQWLPADIAIANFLQSF